MSELTADQAAYCQERAAARREIWAGDGDAKECAFIRLRGSTERLFLVLQYRNDHNYEIAMQAVETAMAEYRAMARS